MVLYLSDLIHLLLILGHVFGSSEGSNQLVLMKAHEEYCKIILFIF